MAETPKTWLIVGASRGIGLEFVRQIVALGHSVIATVRSQNAALDAIHQKNPDKVQILTCDVSNNESIEVKPLTMTNLKDTLLILSYRTLLSNS